MATEPRQHHYIPACYLAQFGEPAGSRQARLRVFDRKTGAHRGGTVGKEARVRDFYAVVHREPNIVEKTLAQFEKRYATVIKVLVAKNSFPSDKDVNVLVDFVALQLMRTPTARSWLNTSYMALGKGLLNILESRKGPPIERVLGGVPGSTDPGRMAYALEDSARSSDVSLRRLLEAFGRELEKLRDRLDVPVRLRDMTVAEVCGETRHQPVHIETRSVPLDQPPSGKCVPPMPSSA
jgi:hypothetical protein